MTRRRRALRVGACLALACAFWTWAGICRADMPAAASPELPWSRAADTLFQNITATNGLLFSVVDRVVQDSAGYIWLQTQNGLVRWDGYRPQFFRPNRKDPHALPTSIVAGLIAGRQGRIWVGANHGEMAYYDPALGHFVRVQVSVDEAADMLVQQLAQESPRRYWAATSTGLYRVDEETPSDPQRVSAMRSVLAPGMPKEVFNSVLFDARGQGWAGGHSGLYLKRDGAANFERFSMPGPANQVIHVLGAVGDTLWVYGMHKVYTLDVSSMVVHEVTSLQTVIESVGADFTSVVRADAGHTWFGTRKGIAVLDNATQQVRFIRHDPLRMDSLLSDNVRHIFKDRSGLIWVGTDLGLSIYDPSQRAVSTLTQMGNVAPILSLPDGRVLLSVARGDLTDLRQIGPFDDHPRPFVKANEAALAGGKEVNTMLQLDDGTIAIGTKTGLFRFDATGRLLQKRVQPPEVTSLWRDGQTLWIGTAAEGLWSVDLGRSDFRPRRFPMAPDPRIASIDLVGPRMGTMRMIVSLGNLLLLDESTGTVHPPVADDAAAGELSGSFVPYMEQDAKGRIWVATAENGLYILAPGKMPGHFTARHFTTEEGLPSNFVDTVLFDRKGTAWLSTDGGLASMDPDTLALKVYDRKDGVSIPDYWAHSGAVTSDGSLLFGSHLGVTVMRPSLLKSWDYEPPTVVTSIQIGDSPRQIDAVPAMLTVPAKEQKFAVEFAALDYSAPMLNRYRYQLEGYDEHWIETDPTRRTASYTNLKPGRYMLRLQGSSRTGQWGGERRLSVEVLPNWYQTWWFTAAMVGVLGVTVGLGHLVLTARLRRHRAALEHAVRLRTQEVMKQKQMVDQKAKELEAVNRQLELISLTDPLTGLNNRRYLDQCIEADTAAVLRRHEEAAMAEQRTAGAKLSFFMVDLDHFKSVNDVYGHAAGDAVLKDVAARLRAIKRESDRLVRWGGEEFMLVTRETEHAAARVIGERICKAMSERPFEMAPGVLVRKTCSVGFATYPFSDDAPKAIGWQQVVEVADHALYLAKQGGRDAWVGLSAGHALGMSVEAAKAAVADVRRSLVDGRLTFDSRRPMPIVNDMAVT